MMGILSLWSIVFLKRDKNIDLEKNKILI